MCHEAGDYFVVSVDFVLVKFKILQGFVPVGIDCLLNK